MFEWEFWEDEQVLTSYLFWISPWHLFLLENHLFQDVSGTQECDVMGDISNDASKNGTNLSLVLQDFGHVWNTVPESLVWKRVVVPSGEPTKSNWKWPFIVDFPIKNGDFPLLC